MNEYSIVNVYADFLAQYNVFTNEVTCEGIKISLSRFEVLPLDPLVKTTFQLREQGLIDLSNPSMKVSYIIDIVLYYHQGWITVEIK